MVAVQMNNQTLFQNIWNWAKIHMWHTDENDPRYGYFSWHDSTSGRALDQNPASDGETWFISALYMAHARWNVEEYKDAADTILSAARSKTGKVRGLYFTSTFF